MTEQTARRIEKLLVRLLAVLEPKSDTPKPVSAASVSAVLTRSGRMFTDDASETTPRQTEDDVVMTRMGKARRVTRIVGAE